MRINTYMVGCLDKEVFFDVTDLEILSKLIKEEKVEYFSGRDASVLVLKSSEIAMMLSEVKMVSEEFPNDDEVRNTFKFLKKVEGYAKSNMKCNVVLYIKNK